MSGLPNPTTEQLVSAACLLKQSIAQQLDDLEKIEARIIALGAGKYAGLIEGESVTTVAASLGTDKLMLKPEDVPKAKRLANRNFRKLFVPVVLHMPCKAFVEVARAVLTPACSAKLIALCSFPTNGKKAHCRDYRFAPVAAQ